MPPEGAFPSAEAFAGTLAHELGHWTGAEHRLNRRFGAWGTDAYAAEELRAEICSACLCAQLGIATPMDNHAAFVGAWVKKLREDKYEIFRAAKDARRMVDLLIGRLEPHSKSDEPLKARAAEQPGQGQKLQAMYSPVANAVMAALGRARAAVDKEGPLHGRDGSADMGAKSKYVSTIQAVPMSP